MLNLKFKNGHYKVGNEIFEGKVAAVHRANQLKTHWEWYFHDDIMKTYDWTQEPVGSLNDFYFARARQIRENYDYVLVFCSGGADSTNALYSFLKNGLHVDEVVASAPLSGLKNWDWDNTTCSAENTISETKFAQLPLMQEVHNDYPKTKITIHDYFIDMLDYKTDDWLLKSGDYIHPTFAGRYNLERPQYSYIRQIADSGKKVALVYGIDKPFLAYKDGMFYTYFRDALVCNGFRSIEHPGIDAELFYYSPDLVPMLIKQAHVTARWICEPGHEDYRLNAVLSPETVHRQEATRKYLGIYERDLVPTIYPILGKKAFQCHKPSSSFMGAHDAWFPYLHRDSRARQLMTSDYKLFIRGIDTKYFRKDYSGNILGFHLANKFHRIGKEENFGV